MSSLDPYAALGVSKNASEAEIKKAFRQKAKEHHPDKGGDEKKFKEINAAYEILGNAQKRAQYDQFGSADFGGAGGFDASNFGGFSAGGFEDVFSSFFGGNSSGHGSKKSSGNDLEVEIHLSFEESVRGVEKKFSGTYLTSCDKCHGKGGNNPKKCSTCDGNGYTIRRVSTPFGAMQQQIFCSTCGGEGSSFEDLCSVCKGEGRKSEKSDISVPIPAGVEDGTTLKFRGKGEAGYRGNAAGDLYVRVRAERSKKFSRQGLDLSSELKISVFDAILGGKFTIETFWGKDEVEIPENTREYTLVRLPGKGIKTSHKTGDHLVKIVYEMPKKVTAEMREMLEKIKN